MDLSWNSFSCGGFSFSDQRLVDRLRRQRCPESREFFTALALCHTVVCEWNDGQCLSVTSLIFHVKTISE